MGARSAGQWVLPRCSPFLEPEAYITLRWAFRRLLWHCIRNKGEGGGGWRYTGGAWAWKTLPSKPLSPIPEPIGAGDLTQSKVFMGPRDALTRGSHWELLFFHWEERGLVTLQRSGRKLECIPQWESILGGVYDPGQEASYEGAVEGLTITRPIKPLGRAAPATSSITAPVGAPQGTPPSQLRMCGPLWAPRAPSDQSRILRYVRS